MGDRSVVFINRFPEAINLYWLPTSTNGIPEPENAADIGLNVKPGGRVPQGTHVGHVFEARSVATGKTLHRVTISVDRKMNYPIGPGDGDVGKAGHGQEL